VAGGPLTRRDRVESRQAVGLTPNCWRNQRENALGAAKPSSSEISVSENRSIAR